ncbi:lipopolysaccharide biosynthesis protein [Hymenobacter fastidiosus]|uniref:Lipopolysaccharide biosynthesis protein n=1 Tax=Hymenobacter fastidiosus TaxID=486264 RepID=A0ABP7RCQ8_9BACT
MAHPQNLTSATVHGVKWTTAATVTNAVLQVGYSALMARLLSPAAFGLVALAGVVLRFGTYFAQMGMEQAIIQKPELSATDVRAAFTSSLLLGAVFAGLLAVGAPLAASLVRQPEVLPVVRVLAISIFLTGLNATALSLLRRQMRFRTLAIIEVISYVLSYAGLGLVLAWQDYGVWALVGATLGQGLLITVLSYGAVRHSVRLLFSWAAYRPLVAYGSRMSAISFVEFINGSLDTVLIGRLLGATALGIYSRGWMLVGLPVYLLTTSVAKVAFPSFSQVQADRPKLRRVYLSSITLIAALVMPICAGAAVAAPEIVEVLLGPKWGAAVPILRIISFAFALSLVTMFAGIVCDATATLLPKLALNVATMLILTGLFFGLSPYGLRGVAAAVVLGEVVRTLFYLLLMRRVLTVPGAVVLRAYGPGVLAAVAVAGGTAVVSYGLRTAGSVPLLTLLLQMLTGGGVLLTLAWLAPPTQLREILRRLLDRPTPDGPPTGLVNRLLAGLAARLASPDGVNKTMSAAAEPGPGPARRPHPVFSPDPETELV